MRSQGSVRRIWGRINASDTYRSVKIHDQPQASLYLFNKIIWQVANFLGQETFIHCKHLENICSRVV